MGWRSRATPSGRLCAIQDGSARCYGEDGSFGGTVSALYEDSRGNLWAGSDDRAVAMEAGSAETLSDARHAAQSEEGDDGALLIAMSGGIRQLVDGKAEAVSPSRHQPPV